MKKIIFVLLALLIPTLAEAATRWVSVSGGAGAGCAGANISTSDPGGSNYQTYAQGAACLNPGDTLVLKGGTYTNSHVVVPSGSASSFGNATVIKNAPGETVTFTGSMPVEVYNTVHHIIIDGSDGNNTSCSIGSCTTRIVYDGSAGASETSTNTSSFIRFKGVEFKNHVDNGLSLASPGGGAGGHEVLNSKIHDNGDTSLSGTPQDHGIYLKSPNSIIDGNDIYSNCGAGIHGYSADAITYGSNANTIVSNNRVRNNGTCAGTMHAIIMSQGANMRVYNNLVYGNDGNGIVAYNINADGLQVYNNTVYNNTEYGLYLYGGVATGTIWRNNIAENNGFANFYLEGGIAAYSNNLCSAALPICIATTETATTTFNNPGAGDFTLKAGSVAISGGAPLASPFNVDIMARPRPQGSGWDLGAYEYTTDIPTPPTNQLVLALPLDEGSGTIAADVSGLKNNASLVGGATWDISGKYGKAIALDGTGYLNVPAASSLALSPSMTLEAWVYPTTSFSGFAAVIRHERYYLYAASDSGYCPTLALAPLGGYSSTVDNVICATSLPPPAQWSYLAVTYDGTTLTFYLNGSPIASRTSTDPMVPSSYPVTIGASEYGEYFVGKIDEPRIYTYVRTPAQIVSDMNTPLIGGPGKYVEIAAPASVEISSSASIEISAD